MRRVKVKTDKVPTHAFAWESMPGVYAVTYHPAGMVDRGQHERDLFKLAQRGVKVVVTRNFLVPGVYDVRLDKTGNVLEWLRRPDVSDAAPATC
jgi:hypothetical protein